MKRPLLAVTLGDPAGVGPEIALRLATRGRLEEARILLVGDRGVLAREVGLVEGAQVPLEVEHPEAMAREGLDMALFQPRAPLAALPERGHIDARAGEASHAWVVSAARLALEGRVDGIVTGPIHKEAWRRAGVEQAGHTEALRDLAGVARVLMLLAGGRLRCALQTIHVALRDVPSLITTADVIESLLLLSQEVGRWYGPARPRIAACGLNPHAGEGGLFGREENDVLEPAVEAARGRGVDAHGPLPADACIPAAAQGGFDAVLAMYHDQALPTVKALAPRRAVNVTLGLPFVRTSVDHGTAFDIAGRGLATESSLQEAVRHAARMATSPARGAQ